MGTQNSNPICGPVLSCLHPPLDSCWKGRCSFYTASPMRVPANPAFTLLIIPHPLSCSHLMIVWRIREKIVRTVQCCHSCRKVVHNDTYTHTYQHFSKMSVGLGLVFLCLFRFNILCGFSGLAWTILFLSCFFRTAPRDWLGRTSPK